jgi:hypothetical protein
MPPAVSSGALLPATTSAAQLSGIISSAATTASTTPASAPAPASISRFENGPGGLAMAPAKCDDVIYYSLVSLMLIGLISLLVHSIKKR